MTRRLLYKEFKSDLIALQVISEFANEKFSIIYVICSSFFLKRVQDIFLGMMFQGALFSSLLVPSNYVGLFWALFEEV